MTIRRRMRRDGRPPTPSSTCCRARLAERIERRQPPVGIERRIGDPSGEQGGRRDAVVGLDAERTNSSTRRWSTVSYLHAGAGAARDHAVEQVRRHVTDVRDDQIGHAQVAGLVARRHGDRSKPAPRAPIPAPSASPRSPPSAPGRTAPAVTAGKQRQRPRIRVGCGLAARRLAGRDDHRENARRAACSAGWSRCPRGAPPTRWRPDTAPRSPDARRRAGEQDVLDRGATLEQLRLACDQLRRSGRSQCADPCRARVPRKRPTSS